MSDAWKVTPIPEGFLLCFEDVDVARFTEIGGAKVHDQIAAALNLTTRSQRLEWIIQMRYPGVAGEDDLGR